MFGKTATNFKRQLSLVISFKTKCHQSEVFWLFLLLSALTQNMTDIYSLLGDNFACL